MLKTCYVRNKYGCRCDSVKYCELEETKQEVFRREYIQHLATKSADEHFDMKHEGDWYAHYYGFIYGFQKAEEQCYNKYHEK